VSTNQPTLHDLLALLRRIEPHALELPPELAIEMQKTLGRFPGNELSEAPDTGRYQS
jgi:hypothetical protein